MTETAARPRRRPLFEEEETETAVRDLRVGDFLVRYAGGEGLRPARVNSGITELTPAWDVYAYRAAVRGGRRMPCEAYWVRTLSGVDVAMPSHHRVTVRRRLPVSV